MGTGSVMAASVNEHSRLLSSSSLELALGAERRGGARLCLLSCGGRRRFGHSGIFTQSGRWPGYRQWLRAAWTRTGFIF